jgi:CubicO group peptidase (beta-lactamase class C family)
MHQRNCKHLNRSTTMKKIKTITLVLLSFFSLICFGQHGKFAEVDKALQRLEDKREFNGSVLVAKSSNIIYQRNFGLADMEHGVPINASTKFELASVSKTFTALLILQLVEKGKIKLDAKVSDFIPEFTRRDSGEITIHHLLSHTSGIQDFVGLNCPFTSWTEKEFLEGLAKTPINFKVGARFEYASSTYVLLRFLIERVTGNTYESNLREHILKPAGMNNSGVFHNAEIVVNRASGYINTEKGFKNALPISNHDIFLGAASIYSTASDLQKFDRALYDDILLSSKLKEQMYTMVQPPYGYGWFINDDTSKGKVVAHGGDIFGFTTLLERRLKDKVLIVILSNLQSIDRDEIVKILDRTLE